MSKERELLKKILATRWLDHELSCEAEKLLAQPEQTEQEPVAWMNDSGGCFLSDGNKYSEQWTPLYASPPKQELLSDEQKRLAAIAAKQREAHEQDLREALREGYNQGFNDGKYLSSPKREPLSEDKLDVLAEANISDEAIAGYYLGFRDAEKHHGIGGGE
jgi:flagellar biosynthesis/type III secretory pathway protein FliH